MRKYNYVIGYKSNGNVVYGKEENKENYAMPMTLCQAKKMAKRTFTLNMNRKVNTVVFKLVQVKEDV